MMNTMKALIAGFLSYEEGTSLIQLCLRSSTNLSTGGQKRRNAASLTSYDINLLRAWSEHVRKSSGQWSSTKRLCSPVLTFLSDGNVLPPLVVVLHHFEQFNTDVVQDLFHICRYAAILLLMSDLHTLIFDQSTRP
jgi:hypothetical protein